ncbi:MAG: glyoxalase/bleomycin resistance/dioxygenase family protein [Aestuariibacter sp.]
MMKRFHVHVAVDDLTTNIEFYNRLFGQEPAKQNDDYAKWMLDDPRVNFAISSRCCSAGLDHFGIQTDSKEELKALEKSANLASGGNVIEQKGANCCYAKSDKHWTIDPQGLAWEHFHTMSDAVSYGKDTLKNASASASASACCASPD